MSAATKLPPVIANFCTNFDAWIVGSAANPDPSLGSPRDWDLLIPWREWHKACCLVPREARPNSFGGWKFTIGSLEIDIWPGDLSFVMKQPRSVYAWHPQSNTRISKRLVD